MADDKVEDEHLSQVDVSSLKELIEELVTLILDEVQIQAPIWWVPKTHAEFVRFEIPPLPIPIRQAYGLTRVVPPENSTSTSAYC